MRKNNLRWIESKNQSSTLGLLREKLLKIKGRLAHKKPNMNLDELLHLLCDEKIEQLERAPSAPGVKTMTQMRRIVWQKADRKCSHCGLVHALEIDHVVPKAKGGESRPENLRLLCRHCNQRAAIEHFGAKKMAQYLR